MPDRAAVPGRAAAPVRPGAAPLPPRGRARGRHLWRGAVAEITARWDTLAVIAAGGALGSLARWGLSAALPHPAGAFGWATFLENVTGCALIGALMVLLTEAGRPSRYLRPFLGIGVLGGYTTFSSYMLDARTLLVTGHAGLAGAYLAATLAAGLAAVWAGMAGLRAAIWVARWRARRQADSKRPASNRQPPRSP